VEKQNYQTTHDHVYFPFPFLWPNGQVLTSPNVSCRLGCVSLLS